LPRIKKHPARAIIGDLTPFELPLSASTTKLYDLVKSAKIRVAEDASGPRTSKLKISWSCDDPSARKTILAVVCSGVTSNSKMGAGNNPALQTKISEKQIDLTINSGKFETTPMRFQVKHKPNRDRTLAIMHPIAQLALAEFIERNSAYILYLCRRSNFSLRKPIRVASLVSDTWVTRKARNFKERQQQWLGVHVNFETNDSEEIDSSNQLHRTFFVNGPYGHAYQYHASELRKNAELKYKWRLRLDVESCFDSIYTHSISWAGLGKTFAKNHRTSSFFDEFDRLIRFANNGETNGIIIGPEVSRIFAEVVLQAVDVELEEQLRSQYRLVQGQDYEIHRYVDDYFIYTHTDLDAAQIEVALSNLCKSYKLRLSSDKRSAGPTPNENEISSGKEKIRSLIFDYTWVAEWQTSQDGNRSWTRNRSEAGRLGLVAAFDAIMISCAIDPRDIASFTMGRLLSRLIDLCHFTVVISNHTVAHEKVDNVGDISNFYKDICSKIEQIFELALHLYQLTPRVSTALGLAKLGYSISDFEHVTGAVGYVASIVERYATRINLVLMRSGDFRNYPIESGLLLWTLSLTDNAHLIDRRRMKQLLDQLQETTHEPPDSGNAYLAVSQLVHFAQSENVHTDLASEFYTRWVTRRIDALLAMTPRGLSTELQLIYSDVCETKIISSQNKLKLLLLIDSAHESIRDELWYSLTQESALASQKDIEQVGGSTSFFVWSKFDPRKAVIARQGSVIY
jgi:hypothetical protein